MSPTMDMQRYRKAMARSMGIGHGKEQNIRVRGKDSVLFLDIDSVLNHYQSTEVADFRNAVKSGGDITCGGKYMIRPGYGPGHVVHSDLLNRLQNIIEITGCQVVGISSWFEARENVEDLKEISDFLRIRIREVGYHTGGGMERYHGVLDWLNDNQWVKHIVILDDGPMDADFQLKPYHVQPLSDGLTEKYMNECIATLKLTW